MLDQNICNLIKKEVKLPTLPAIAAQILQAVNKDDAALSELGKIISVDPALSAKMLRVANSGLFTCSKEITDIKRAVSVLGTNTIKSIALSFVISTDLSQQEEATFCLDEFWRHSVTAAVAAELVGKKLKRSNPDLFLIALLQDLGILVTLLTKGEEYKSLLDNHVDSPEDLCSLEITQYGFDHQQVTALLFQSWNFPDSLAIPVRFHHRPDEVPDSFRKLVEVLNLADLIADVYAGKVAAEKARLLQERLAERYGLDKDECVELLDDVAEKSREIITLFEVDPLDLQPYSVLLQQANEELGKLNLSSSQLILELQEAKEQNQRLILKLQDANSRLKEMVYHDSLTGVYNHRYFQEALDAEVARATRYRSSLSLVFFDLDDFKQVNDNYGHLVGDMVLMNIAKAVNNAVRTNDVVARYGGDEFSIILPSTNKEGAKAFAEHLRSCVEGIATLVEGKWINVTISIGAATVVPGERATSKDGLLEAADKALYQAKKAGRNQVVLLDTAD